MKESFWRLTSGEFHRWTTGTDTFRHRADKSDSSGSVDLQSTASVMLPEKTTLPVLLVRRNSNWSLRRVLQGRKSSADLHDRFLSERLETHPHARKVDLRLHGMRSRGPSFPLSVSSSETGRRAPGSERNLNCTQSRCGVRTGYCDQTLSYADAARQRKAKVRIATLQSREN